MKLWYIGTEYSRYAGGLDAAFEMACMQTALLARHGVPVLSPIAHSHPVSRYLNVSPTDHEFWVEFDAPLVALATGLVVVMTDGWKESRGLAHEISEFTAAGKPIVYMTPGIVPCEFTPWAAFQEILREDDEVFRELATR